MIGRAVRGLSHESLATLRRQGRVVWRRGGCRKFTVHMAEGVKPTPFVRFLQLMNSTRVFSEKRKFELYPPFFMMRVKVLAIENGWRHLRVKLPLNWTSRNPGGVMFGGYQSCVADPFPAIAW